MKNKVKNIVCVALEKAGVELPEDFSVIIEKTRDESHGDFATNAAMMLGKVNKKAPRQIAEGIVAEIEKDPLIEKVEIAGPGFINMTLSKSFFQDFLKDILECEDFGKSTIGNNEKIQVEYVSANPTGPLHVGHGRGAAVGDSLSRILKEAGFDVINEYYVNDVGSQMNTLAETLRVRYLEALGQEIEEPEKFYKGDYMKDIAKEFLAINKDKYKDEDKLDVFKNYAMNEILNDIKDDLKNFRVHHDVWYSEKSLFERGLVQKTIAELEDKNIIYEKDGAKWFKSSDYGDEKDRVVRKADGDLTYFASDMAYHREKLERGFTSIIDIWGADHHGYEPRVRALFEALGKDKDALSVIFIQLVSLVRNGEPVSMSTRAGSFVTLREVYEEVGVDATRWFFLARKSDSQLEFDLELAKTQAPENPVYYVQYCHARIASIFQKARESGVKDIEKMDFEKLKLLKEKEEINIIKLLGIFPEVIEKSALAKEPHRITYYLTDLASMFHNFYNKHKVVTENMDETRARLMLITAVKKVVAKGLDLLGISAPEKM